MDNKQKILPWLIFASALIIYTVGLSKMEIIMIDTRFALFVHEMRENGIFAFPQHHGNFYPDYTSVPVILMYLASLIFGGVNQFTIVLPSAIAMAAMVALVYVIGRRMHSAYFGLAGAIMMFAAYELVSIGRIASIDAYPALAATLCFYLLYSADQDKKYRRLWWLPVAMIFGFAMRGPIGTVIPTAVCVSYCLVAGKWRRLFITGATGAVLLGGLLALFAYSAYLSGGDKFLAEFWDLQITGRISNVKPPWYYLTDAVGSFALTYPLALMVLIVYLICRKKDFFKLARPQNEQTVQFLAAWALVIILGMSIPGTKHLRYITGAFPPLSLLAAVIMINPGHLKFLTWFRIWFVRVISLMPLVALIALPVGAWILRLPAVVKALDGVEIKLPLMIPCLLLLVFNLAVFNMRKGIRRRERNILLLGIMAIIIVLARIMVVEVAEQYINSSRKFVQKVEEIRQDRPLYFLFIGFDGDANKYMANVDRKKIFVPKEITAKDLKALEPGSLIIVREDHWRKRVDEALRKDFSLVTEGQLARRECLLMIKNQPEKVQE